MIKKIFSLILICLLLMLTQCTGDDGAGILTEVNSVAVDSTNDRVFVSGYEADVGPELFAFTASDQEEIGDQPLVDDETSTDVFDVLPTVSTAMAAYANGASTRLFIMGAMPNDDGDLVTNRVLVLDFDGSTFTEASFSPISLTDDDATTTDESDTFSDLWVDQNLGVFYASDATSGVVHVIDVSDGTAVVSPVDIGGEPQGLALADGHLYVCNSSAVAEEQVISVINTTDFTTTEIDIDAPCDLIAVDTNDTSTLLLAKDHTSSSVYLRLVDTTTFASSIAITATDAADGFVDGIVSAGLGVTSTIQGIALAHDSSGTYYAYLSEQDGNVEFITLDSAGSAYDLEELSTTALNIGETALYVDSSGFGVTAFLLAETGSLLFVDIGDDDIDGIN